MNRRALGSVLFGLLTGCMMMTASLPDQKTDRAREGLVGRVKEVVTKSDRGKTIQTFDPAGALIEMESYVKPPPDQPEMGEQKQKFVYVYDPHGSRTSELIVEDGQQYLSRLYAYDQTGRKIAEAAYHMCGTFSSLHVYSHDTSGNVREDILFQFRSLSRQVFSHKDGLPVQQEAYKNGALRSTTTYTYDHSGRLTEQRVYQPDQTLVNRTRYGYDERGNRIAEETNDTNNPSLIVKRTSLYEYDTNGNWIKRTARRSTALAGLDVPSAAPVTEVTERELTYY
ncbi:MAG TPA: hypothetical protein VH681_08805 [Nitrospiraceae bacterium]